MVECKYRGRVIGWLVTGADGFLEYLQGAERPDAAFFSVDGGRTWNVYRVVIART